MSSAAPSGPVMGRPVRTIPAATLIVVDRTSREPRLLMGRRRPDVVFLPDKYVFPGGRLEDADAMIATLGNVPSGEAARLGTGIKGVRRAALARALAVAAIRETFEETGYLFGCDRPPDGLPDDAGWQDIVNRGFVPDLSRIRYVARAVTPPGRPRRYDTRFFMTEGCGDSGCAFPTDGELTRIDWFTLDEISRLDLPGVTARVLKDLSDTLEGRSINGIPCYFWRGGAFKRVFLSQRPLSA